MGTIEIVTGFVTPNGPVDVTFSDDNLCSMAYTYLPKPGDGAYQWVRVSDLRSHEPSAH